MPLCTCQERLTLVRPVTDAENEPGAGGGSSAAVATGPGGGVGNMGGVLVAFADVPPSPPDGGVDWAVSPGGPVSVSCAAAVARRETSTMQARAAAMSTAPSLIDSPL